MGLLEVARSTQVAAPRYARDRRFPRRRFDVRIQVSVFREGVTSVLWGRTNELSADGLGATLSGELTVGEVVSMEFPVPIAPHVIKVRAVVRYTDGLRCGFEFLVVTGKQKETLRCACEVLANT
jgi:hypothetical protein